jgi:hypothetical protein
VNDHGVISADRRRTAPAGLALAALMLGAGSLPAQAQLFWPNDDDIYYEAPRRIERPRPRIKRPIPKLADAPRDTPKPQGPLVIAISIEKQTLKIYDSNGLFAETPVSTGMRGHATPTGVFSIIQKNKWHRSNLYSGAPMPYMQRITWSGVALHAGALPGYPASHGCIRLPTNFAQRLWSWTRLGARVIVTPGEVSPADFTHARLAARKPEPRKEAAVAAPAPTDALELRLTPLAPHDEERVQTADASGAMPSPPAAVDAAPEVAKEAATDAPPPLEGAADFIGPVKPRSGHVAAFVSRKDGKLYVRQNFEPVFEAPVTIASPERPLGTHVFTARADADDAGALRWSVVSLPTPVRVARRDDDGPRRGRAAATAVDMPPPLPPSTAAEALDRLTIPDDAMARIAMALAPGGSLVVSDHGLGDETGRGTDFIVPLR